MGTEAAPCAGGRSLVANRDRLAICANCVGLGMLPVKPGSATKPVPGWDVHVLDGRGKEPPRLVTSAALADQAPFPPGLLTDTLERRRRLPGVLPRGVSGLLQDGDAGYIDEDGYRLGHDPHR